MFKKNLLTRTAAIGVSCLGLAAYLADQAYAGSIAVDRNSLAPITSGELDVESVATGSGALLMVRDAILGREFSADEPVWASGGQSRISSPYYLRRRC